MINNMSRATVKPTSLTHNIVPENLGDEDSFLEEEDNNFAIRNENYQLKSTIHKLEYEKNKLTISYENTIKELKHKYSILEKIMTENNEKEDKGTNQIIETLRAKCQYLTEENEQLKREIHASAEQYRTTPNFKQLNNNSEGFTNLISQLEKPENLAYFQKMLDTGTQKKIDELKEQVSLLQKQNYDLKQLNLRIEREKQQTISAIGKQIEQHHNSVLRFKDKTIQQLKRANIEANLQLQQAKKTISQMSTNQSDSNAQQRHIKVLVGQLREKDMRLAQLEQTISKLEMQCNKAKLQQSKMENDLRLLENQRKDSDAKKKFLQQQIFRLENELNDVKTAAYNQKLETKKQLNSAKIDIEEEKMKLKYSLQEKIQQNKRLKETLMEINESNEQMKQKEMNFTKNIDQILKENTILKDNIEKLMAQNVALQKKLNSTEKFRSLSQQKDAIIDKLKQELMESRQQARRYSKKVQQSQERSKQNSERYNLEVELNHKQELIQLLRMDKQEVSQKVKQLENKLRQKQQKLNETTNKITMLQEKLRYSQEDNKQLLLANDEQREKIEKLKKIKEDIESINAELKRQKNALAEKRREESRMKAQQQSRTRANIFNNQEQFKNFVKEYNQEKENLLQVIKELKAQNYQLQNRLTEAENERDRKGVDLNIKESELKNLKSDNFKPKQLVFQPLVEVAKKNQFNAVVFQNQVTQLQKQISNIRMMKQKQIQECKRTLRKQMEDKYQNQLMRQKAYNNQLEKKCNYLTQKWNEEKKQNQEQRKIYGEIQKENYSLKLQLSQNLQELNKALQRCKYTEQKMKELEKTQKKTIISLDEFGKLKASYDQLAKNFQQQSLLLNNANQQIRRLNDILMMKQSELRVSVKSKMQQISPNNSFMKSNQNQEKQRSIHGMLDFEKQVEGDSIRVWAQRKSGPLYTRI